MDLLLADLEEFVQDHRPHGSLTTLPRATSSGTPMAASTGERALGRYGRAHGSGDQQVERGSAGAPRARRCGRVLRTVVGKPLNRVRSFKVAAPKHAHSVRSMRVR